MPLFDYRCPAGHLTERLLPLAIEVVWCACGQHSARVYSRAAALSHADPDTRGMYRRFSEASAELGGTGPSLWPAAKQRAEAVNRAGENPWQQRK